MLCVLNRNWNGVFLAALLTACCAGSVFAQDHELSGKLVVTEVMWDSGHPGGDPETGIGGLANGDWWELLNISDQPIDMTGFLWDDDDALVDFDYTTFPEFVIQPSEAIIVLRETGEDINSLDGFREVWDIPAGMRILGTDLFEGSLDTFSGLSSGGDELNLYDADEEQIVLVELGESDTGKSISWGFENGEFVELGLSATGEYGAFAAHSDGSMGRFQLDDEGNVMTDAQGQPVLNPEYVPEFLDVASPGRVHGFEVRFPNARPDLDTLCGNVAAGTATADELQSLMDELNIVSGDANQDGSVAFADFLILSASFGSTSATFSDGDFNCDGAVNFADFLALSANFGHTASGAAAVPEPQAGLMMLGMIAGLPLLRRRR